MRPLLRFPRQIGLRRSICTTEEDFLEYTERVGGLSSTYTSLYSFEEMENDRKPDYDSACMDKAWWDFDMVDGGTIDDVKLDVVNLINKLSGDVRVVATGRGFHVYQFLREPVFGRDWAHKLDRYEKQMAKGLDTLDGVGYPEKITRVPGTYNPKRGKWAVVINKDGFLEDPLNYEKPDRPLPNLEFHDPFLGVETHEYDTHFSLLEWVRDNPQKKRVVKTQVVSQDIGNSGVALPTCLDRAIRVSNPPHHVRVALGQTMAANLRFFANPKDLTAEQTLKIEDKICSFISTLGWQDYNPHVTRKAVKSLLHYSRYPSPAWFRKNNLCAGDCWYCGD